MIWLKDSLLFPAIQSIHLMGIALLVGTIVLVDIRALGYALQRHSVAEVSRSLSPWMWAGLSIMLATGPLLFGADAMRYSRNPAFLVKMMILLAALIFHFTLHHRSEPRTRLVAIVSIALWTAVVIGGRAIADFDI
jgi:hypothetical protein